MPVILSIEDDADIQHIIGQVLFREGYELHYAWNGEEGYEKILGLDLDLIITDLMLPLMNGVELLKKLKENKATQDIPVIIVTAFGDKANMLKYSVEALGAAAYLPKPIQIPELVSRVKQTLASFPRAKRRLTAALSEELSCGCIRADPKFSTVWVNDRLIATLPFKEFTLLSHLMKNPGPTAKENLLQALGYEVHQIAALKQAIHRLRQAFGPSQSRRIKTTPTGYELIS